MGFIDLLLGKKSTEEYLQQIEKLKEKLVLKEQEVERLVFENDGLKAQLQQLDAAKIPAKQLEIFEKNVKESREEAAKLINVLKNFGISIKKKYYTYKVEIAVLLAANRFSEILSFLQEKGFMFASELPLETIKEEILGKKNGEEAYRRLEDFKKGKYDWEVSTMRNRGEKLVKIFGRAKKLNQFFSDFYLEYMDDLDRIDLAILETYGFTKEQILELEEKRNHYYNEYRE